MSDCSTCGAKTYCAGGCGDAHETDQPAAALKLALKEGSTINVTYAIMGAKGGVGNTTTVVSLARSLKSYGKKVAILDAHISTPDVIHYLGAVERATLQDDAFVPQIIEGIPVMSYASFMTHDDEPMLWDSRMMAGIVQAFWQSACWGDIDILLVDVPSGMGDLALTILDTLPLTGSILVTTTDERSLKRAEQVRNALDWRHVRCLGLIVNEAHMGPVQADPTIAATRMGLTILDHLKAATSETDFSKLMLDGAATRILQG